MIVAWSDYETLTQNGTNHVLFAGETKANYVLICTFQLHNLSDAEPTEVR